MVPLSQGYSHAYKPIRYDGVSSTQGRFETLRVSALNHDSDHVEFP